MISEHCTVQLPRIAPSMSPSPWLRLNAAILAVLIWTLLAASAWAVTDDSRPAHRSNDSSQSWSDGRSDEWPDEWPEEFDLASRVALVNEGELAFIPNAAAEGAHYHRNRIAITEASLDETSLDLGWVDLVQCHENLDAVPAAQILFREDGIRELAIEQRHNIGQAWVEGHSVQLRDVGPSAKLCIRAQSRALQSLGDGLYRLRNGPYMRRFLDGYYPMRVALRIDYPGQRLRLVGQTPESQEGFSVDRTRNAVRVDATFEGRLITCFDFCDREDETCGEMAPDCVTPVTP